MNLRWCQEPEKGLLQPDLVFLLKLTQDAAAKRPQFGEEVYENIEFQQRVNQAYNDLSKEYPNWEIVDADGSIDNVHKILLQKVLDKMEEVEDKPIGILNFKPYPLNGVVTLV